MELIETEKRLYKSWRIVRLINILEERIKEIQEIIRSKGKHFYITLLKYRDLMAVSRNRIENLRSAYISLNV